MRNSPPRLFDLGVVTKLIPMLKAYKYRLYPNHEQRVLIEKHFIRQQALADLAGLASV